mmetsp:Transcript_119736/g.344033  ORF Transcript_119736/g.344033 Transcript_119736/m.344033 type:complete len:348 (+) Transcript_119736:653-1696(+)
MLDFPPSPLTRWPLSFVREPDLRTRPSADTMTGKYFFFLASHLMTLLAFLMSDESSGIRSIWYCSMSSPRSLASSLVSRSTLRKNCSVWAPFLPAFVDLAMPAELAVAPPTCTPSTLMSNSSAKSCIEAMPPTTASPTAASPRASFSLARLDMRGPRPAGASSAAFAASCGCASGTAPDALVAAPPIKASFRLRAWLLPLARGPAESPSSSAAGAASALPADGVSRWMSSNCDSPSSLALRTTAASDFASSMVRIADAESTLPTFSAFGRNARSSWMKLKSAPVAPTAGLMAPLPSPRSRSNAGWTRLCSRAGPPHSSTNCLARATLCFDAEGRVLLYKRYEAIIDL